ncbi:MAG: DUF2461 domain-containing protein [Chitinophagaceae bacterium]|nr:DUF2461 domain-containing protein [Chitinophagaceae bacterium]
MKALKANNDKAWMDANRQAYLAAKADFELFAAGLLTGMQAVDPDLAGLQVKDCTFRINRDIRFSANKAPYKTNMAFYLAKGGKKTVNAGYYCHVEPGGCFVAGGMWMPMPPELKKVRQEIDYNFADFKKILTEKGFKKQFGGLQMSSETQLTRPPKGYEADNEAIEFIRLKSFIASMPLEDAVFTGKNAVETVLGTFKLVLPLVKFLNLAIQED